MARKSKWEVEINNSIEHLKDLKKGVIDSMRNESISIGVFSLENQIKMIRINAALEVLIHIKETVEECKR